MAIGIMMSATRLQPSSQSACFRKCTLPSQPRARFVIRASESDTPPATKTIGDTLSSLDLLVQAPAAKPDEAAIKVAEIRRNTGPAMMPQGIGAAPRAAAATAKKSTAGITAEDYPGFAETLNGRAAMLGFVALVGNEVGTGDSFWGQLASGGGAPMVLIVFSVMVASFAPYVTGAVDVRTAMNKVEPPRELGIFRAALERSAGRAAMMGIAGVAALELIMSGAFFS